MSSMTPQVSCHNCGARGMSTFYRVDGIPAHSVLLMPSREEAVSYPRRDLNLAFCESCGFIGNTVFDPNVHEYSTRYEETQGFSPTFNDFARGLARRWIERHGLRNKTILEIGCGKGEFLVLMCELGPNRGIGVDPAYVKERTQSEAASRIQFIQDFYSDKHAHLQADFICCRHTLEHIQPTREFMLGIRRSIGTRHDTIIGFEVPDIARVLDEMAFWDIYYEHCSYFSLGSLARLFRSCDFDVTNLEKDYGDQYLVLDALPGDGSRGRAFEAEGDLEDLARKVDRFRREIPAKLTEWRQLLADAAREGKTVALWGSGSKAVSFLTTLGIRDEVCLVTDINPYRHHMFMPGTGHEIVPPQALREHRPDLVIAMNPIYLDEIRADLEKMGLHPQLIAV